MNTTNSGNQFYKLSESDRSEIYDFLTELNKVYNKKSSNKVTNLLQITAF